MMIKDIEKHYCECGCGEEVAIFQGTVRRFRHGHCARLEKNRKIHSDLMKGNKLFEGFTHSEKAKKQMSLDRMGENGVNYKHGECCKGNSRDLYRVWLNMIQRVTSPKNKSYKYYGARGISICEEWKDSTSFFNWAKSHGYKKELEIDRIDNNGNYEPSNCRFITHQENMLNTRKRDNWGIHKMTKTNAYYVSITRKNHTYYVGKAKDIESAVVIRDAFLLKLETNNL